MLVSIVCIAGACNPTPEVKPAASPSPAATSSPVATPVSSPGVSPSPGATVTAGRVEALVGRWTGADGKYVNITKKGDKYSVEMSDTAGPKTYDGTAKGELIEFVRNGKTETIKAVSGTETGVKGLEKETDCVVITKGTEGFCKK